MAKIIKKATKSPLVWVVAGLVIVVGVGFILVPQLTRAVIGTITIDPIFNVSGSTYGATGTWAPTGAQCWTKGGQGDGGTFHYKVQVYEDLNSNTTLDAGEETGFPLIQPAACNGDYLDPVASADRDLGGAWPATGQPDATFTLGVGSHAICAALIHVNNQGQDIGQVSTCAQTIIVEEPEEPFCGNGTIDNEEECDTYSPVACTTPEGYAGSQTCNMPQLDIFTITRVIQYCTWNSCVTEESCGDGIKNGLEQCDGDSGVGEHQTCTENCTLEAVPYCGDSIKNGDELCDGTDGVGEHQTCTANCTLEAVPYCGDGIKNGTEQCDKTDGITGSQTCSTDCKIVEPTPTPTTPQAEVVLPTITLTKLDTPDPVAAGADLTYTLNFIISNASVTGLVMTDEIPTNTTFVSASDPGKYDATTNNVTWNYGNLNPGNYVATLKVKVYSPLANGTKIANKATIDSNETNALDATAETTVSTAPILTMDKLIDKATALAGDTINYTVKVTNSGTDTAKNVKLTDTLPAGLTFVDNGTNTMTYSFGNIDAGKTVATTYTVKIDSTIAAGTYTNKAEVTADNHAKLTDSVDIAVSVPKVLGEETVQPAPVEEVKVLGEELPETGSGVLALLSGLILTGAGIFLRKRVI